ncbi:MAG TPA: SIS domain-containing protein [Rectinemataceae bacterium]|nr:SIS domain-containing protein [Rectinemataceae bacterium]
MKDETEAILASFLRRRSELEVCASDLRAAFLALERCFRSGGKLLVCGNGGSAADADHIVGELMKGFLLKRPLTQADREALLMSSAVHGPRLADSLQRALPAMSLCGAGAFATAFANDVSGELAFAQAVRGWGRKGDALLALSSSGNSRNVVCAAVAAKAFGLTTVALTGRGGGELVAICDVTIRVPAHETFLVQELHLPVYHALCAMLEEEFFGGD